MMFRALFFFHGSLSATPVANRQAPTVSVSENNHLMGRSIAALIAALRQKGAGADLVAKHVYYAMGHRPIQDERADAVMRQAARVCWAIRCNFFSPHQSFDGESGG